MFIKYQILLYSENQIVDSVNYYGYDDYSATYKAKGLFNSGYFDAVSLSRDGKKVKSFK